MMNLDEIARRLTDVENKIDQIDIRLRSVEQSVDATLNLFGDYKNRTVEELMLMSAQIDMLIRAVESLVITSENKQAVERAKSLRRRLLNNKTRADKKLKEKKRHG